MTDLAVKKRIARAKTRAVNILITTGYKIVPSDNSTFCILAVRKKEIRMIRVVIDGITEHDIETVKSFEPPGICTKEIWCKKHSESSFEMKEIL